MREISKKSRESCPFRENQNHKLKINSSFFFNLFFFSELNFFNERNIFFLVREILLGLSGD